MEKQRSANQPGLCSWLSSRGAQLITCGRFLNFIQAQIPPKRLELEPLVGFKAPPGDCAFRGQHHYPQEKGKRRQGEQQTAMYRESSSPQAVLTEASAPCPTSLKDLVQLPIYRVSYCVQGQLPSSSLPVL